jgi:hypothetical protein
MMSQRTESNGTASPPTNGKQSQIVNCALTALVDVLSAKYLASVSADSLSDVIGCAITSIAIGRSRQLETAGGVRVRAGFSLVIATDDPMQAAMALNHISAPLKYAQAKRHAAMALLDPEMQQQTLDQARREYLAFVESDTMPDPDHVAHYSQQIAEIKNQLRPMMLLENPPPGRLTLASARSADARLLATYDDLALCSLLDNARTPRGRLDFELLGKSFSQQIFDGAFLERVHDVPIVSPMVWAVVIAAPETVARLLLCGDTEVSRFAAGCLIINLADSAPAQSDDMQARNQIALWQQTVTRLVEIPTDHAIVRMDSQAMAAMDGFIREVAIALKDGPGDQGRYLHQLPVLVSKMALGLWAGCKDASDSLTAEHVGRAIEIAKMNSRNRRSILQSWAGDWAKTELENLCELALQKITQHGPLSGRDLCRRCHRKNLDQLTPALDHLMKVGKIAKGTDGKYQVCEESMPDLQVVAG